MRKKVVGEQGQMATSHPNRLLNLSRGRRLKPYSPNKGRGRVQTQIRRAYVAARSDTLSSGELYDWIFPRERDIRWRRGHRLTIWLELRKIAEPIGRASTRGEPWLWRLKDPAAYFGDAAEIPSAEGDLIRE